MRRKPENTKAVIRMRNQNNLCTREPVGDPKKLHPCIDVLDTKSLNTFIVSRFSFDIMVTSSSFVTKNHLI